MIEETEMDNVKLIVSERTETGNGPARRLRLVGQVPGVVYGKSTGSSAVSVTVESLRDALVHGHNVVMELDFSEGDKTKKAAKGKAAPRYAVVKELQFHPVRRNLLHVDLHEIDLKVEIEAPVAIELVGTPAGLEDGGVVDWVQREVTVRALPSEIPTSIELDISELQVGHHISVDALATVAGVTIIDDPEIMVVALVPPRVQEEAPAEAEASAEPEVIGGAKSEE
jgi:large subunit ribosomal protein L25